MINDELGVVNESLLRNYLYFCVSIVNNKNDYDEKSCT